MSDSLVPREKPAGEDGKPTESGRETAAAFAK